MTCSPGSTPDRICVLSRLDKPRFTGRSDTVFSAGLSTYTNGPSPPLRTADTGTAVAPSTVRSFKRTLTNWLGNKLPFALSKRALARTVPVWVSTTLSSARKRPTASGLLRERSNAVTGRALPPEIACFSSGTASCGTANTTSIGAVWVMVTNPVASAGPTRLPTSTLRRPIRPEIGAVMRAKSRFSCALRTAARSIATVPSSCLTSAVCASTSCCAIESCVCS